MNWDASTVWAFSTASAVVEANAVPVFADIRPDTFTIDPAAIRAALTPRTRAIIPVHFAGQPADMDAIMAIARDRGLVVIEDAAHAHGASYRDRPVGSLAHMASFSFQSSKNMTAGEGGIITTNDDRLAAAALQFHRRLVEASGNRTFLSTWDSFHWDVRARVFLKRIAAVHGDISTAYGTHVAIIERLRAGDGPGAAAAVRRNFELFLGLVDGTGAGF